MAFFANGPARAGWAGDRLHAKVIGNGLRELDRFLSVLLDELARASRWDEKDIEELAQIRNTARKISFVSVRMGTAEPDLKRWRALGRSRDCLFYTGGVVRRADQRQGAFMTLGWPASHHMPAHPNTVSIGCPVSLTAENVTWICDFYGQAASKMVQIFSK